MRTTNELRSRVMRRAYAIKRDHGYTFGMAQKLAWLEAREGLLPALAQPRGVRAACRRYGVPLDALEARAAAFVRELAPIVLEAWQGMASPRLTLPPPRSS